MQENPADERQHKLHHKQGGGSEGQTLFHPPATQRWNEQTGGAGQKPSADKMQPSQREEQTDSRKKQKAADEEEREDKTEYLNKTGCRKSESA